MDNSQQPNNNFGGPLHNIERILQSLVLATQGNRPASTKTRDLQPMTSNGTNGDYPDATDRGIFFLFAIPDNYVSGDLTISFWLRGPTSGNLGMYKGSWRHRIGVAELTIDTYPTTFNVAMGTGSILSSHIITASNFQAGDTIRFALNRDGASGADTAAGTATLDRATVSYLGT